MNTCNLYCINFRHISLTFHAKCMRMIWAVIGQALWMVDFRIDLEPNFEWKFVTPTNFHMHYLSWNRMCRSYTEPNKKNHNAAADSCNHRAKEHSKDIFTLAANILNGKIMWKCRISSQENIRTHHKIPEHKY